MLANRDRIGAMLREADLDAAIATSPVNIGYFTDYFCWIDPLFRDCMMVPGASSYTVANYALVPTEGDPTLIVAAIWGVNAATSWVGDLRTYGAGDLHFSLTPDGLDDDRLYQAAGPGRASDSSTEALIGAIEERGLTASRVGIEMENVRPENLERLRAAFPKARFLDCSNLIRLIRMVKSDEEIRRLERSTQINYQASAATLALARPGTRMRDLRAAFIERVTAEGAVLDHFHYSPRGRGISQEPDHVLQAGEYLYVDYGCIYQQYFSDNGTTLVLGDMPADVQRRYNTLRAGLVDAVAFLKPGIPASHLREVMIQRLAADGIHGSNAHGHGLGLELRDYPIIVRANDLRIRDECVDVGSDVPLEAGMVVNLELPLYLFGVGSLHMEQTFVVTADGNRRLDSQDPTEPIYARA